MRLLPLLLVALLSASVVATSVAARTVTIVASANLGAPAQHGLEKFEAAVRAHGWDIAHAGLLDLEHIQTDQIVIATVASSLNAFPFAANLASSLDRPEALVVRRLALHNVPALVFAGTDDRGLMYALLDAAQRISTAGNDATLFAAIPGVTERPFIRDRALSVYTMNRAHWESRFYDEEYWSRYFDLLSADRFNRFLIIFGYENGGFLAPPYPYFFDTPAYPGVHMVGLTREQQQRNLAALNRLIEIAHTRGIAVTLGIWDHIYRAGVQTGGAEWVDDYRGQSIPNSVEGVTTENLNAYTRASLQELLARVPAVDGLHFRIHEESGLTRAEMEGFWREVFQNVRKARPGLFIELRGKGTPDVVIDSAIAEELKPRVETKYWMEQMGLPFHPVHINPPDQMNRRHGYADFLRYPQRYEMTWRLWNAGTSRILLWGDPDYVRRYGATTTLYDSPNWDVQEPLATKMEAQRPNMPTFDLLSPQYRYYDYEFERYWYFFQLWGRLGYNPETPAELWQREFQRRFGPAATEVEAALQRASQVLPRIVASVYPYSGFPTTRGWAERQSLGAKLSDYAKNEGTDVELFENFAHAAERILANGATAKVTPDATSRWFNTTADAVWQNVHAAEANIGSARSKEFDSTITDLKILAQLARFHARRSLAAVHYNLFLRTQRPAELLAATRDESAAVAEWGKLVEAAGDCYTFHLAMGARNYALCGHWRDELALLETDLKSLEAQCAGSASDPGGEKAWAPAAEGDRLPPVITHERRATAPIGQPLRIVVHVSDPSGVASVRLRYRHVTQFEDYATLEMQPTGQPDEYAATIPANFIVPKWNVMYFVEAIDRADNGTMWPDFDHESPYVIVKLERKIP